MPVTRNESSLIKSMLCDVKDITTADSKRLKVSLRRSELLVANCQDLCANLGISFQRSPRSSQSSPSSSSSSSSFNFDGLRQILSANTECSEVHHTLLQLSRKCFAMRSSFKRGLDVNNKRLDQVSQVLVQVLSVLEARGVSCGNVRDYLSLQEQGSNDSSDEYDTTDIDEEHLMYGRVFRATFRLKMYTRQYTSHLQRVIGKQNYRRNIMRETMKKIYSLLQVSCYRLPIADCKRFKIVDFKPTVSSASRASRASRGSTAVTR